eukprot:g13838.t1
MSTLPGPSLTPGQLAEIDPPQAVLDWCDEVSSRTSVPFKVDALI